MVSLISSINNIIAFYKLVYILAFKLNIPLHVRSMDRCVMLHLPRKSVFFHQQHETSWFISFSLNGSEPSFHSLSFRTVSVFHQLPQWRPSWSWKKTTSRNTNKETRNIFESNDFNNAMWKNRCDKKNMGVKMDIFIDLLELLTGLVMESSPSSFSKTSCQPHAASVEEIRLKFLSTTCSMNFP